MNAPAPILLVLGDAVPIMTPLLLAALGGLFTELSGTLNIALEGLITVGAFFSIAAAGATGSLAAGVALGVVASTAFAALFALATFKLRANEFIAGLATNLLASGLAVLLSERVFGTKGVVPFDLPSLPRLGAAALRGLPLLGELFFRHDIFAYASWAAVPLAWAVVAKTPFGMRLRASGSSPRSIEALGLSPDSYRFAAALASGAACGLAGASLSLSLGAYVPNISSGRGWMALVAIYLGLRKPAGVLAACLVFAVADSFANHAQGFLDVPSDFILAMPYLVTLTALVLGAALRRRPG